MLAVPPTAFSISWTRADPSILIAIVIQCNTKEDNKRIILSFQQGADSPFVVSPLSASKPILPYCCIP